MRVKVGEVDDKVKQTKGGSIWRAKASWDGYQDQWTSFYFAPQAGAEYDAKVASREWQGKILWTVKEGQLVGAPSQATTQAAPQQTAPRAPTGYPSRAYVALEKLLGKSVQGYAPEEDKLKAAVFGCMWITMSKDPVTMTEMAEEGAGGGASSSGDEFPTDEEINL